MRHFMAPYRPRVSGRVAAVVARVQLSAETVRWMMDRRCEARDGGQSAVRATYGELGTGRDRAGRNGRGRGDGTGRHRAGRDGTGRDGTERSGTKRDGIWRDETERNGTERDGIEWDGAERDGTGWDVIGRDAEDADRIMMRLSGHNWWKDRDSMLTHILDKSTRQS